MPELDTVTVTMFALQSLSNLALGAVLLQFWRAHRRQYLREWAWSWFALGVYHLLAGATIVVLATAPSAIGARTALSSLGAIGGYWCIAWLLSGTAGIGVGRTWTSRRLRGTLVGLLVAGLLSVLLTIDAASPVERFWRDGLRSLVAAVGLVWAAWLIRRHAHRGGRAALGPRLLLAALGLYALQQTHYFVSLAWALWRPWPFDVLPYAGMADFLLQMLLGLGMVVWMQEDAAAERRAAEESLRRSEEKYRNLVETSNDLIWSVDAQGRWTFINRDAARRIYGYEPEEMLGRPFTDFEPPEVARRDMETFARLKETGQPELHYETTQLRKDGSPVQLSFNAIVLRDERGNVVGTTGTAADITERLRAEEALREKDRAYRTLMSNISGMAYRCRNDPNWSMEIVSEGCRELTGYSPADLLNGTKVNFADLVHPDDREPLWERCQRSLQTRRPCNNEYRIRTASGQAKWVWDQAQGVYGPGGELLAIEGFITDITERKLGSQRQSIMMAELDHRVKNNMAAIVSLAEVSRRSARTLDEYRSALVSRIRAMARVHSTLAQTHWERFDLRQLVSETVQAFVDGDESQVQIEGEDLALPGWMGSALAMTLNELATNAAKYGALSSPQGRLTVRWGVDPDSNGRRVLRFHWLERAGPPVKTPVQLGFGSELIQGGIEHELHGEVELLFDPDGLSCSLLVPLDPAVIGESRYSAYLDAAPPAMEGSR